MDGLVDQWVGGWLGEVNGWMDSEWMDGQMDGSKGEWRGRCNHKCSLNISVGRVVSVPCNCDDYKDVHVKIDLVITKIITSIEQLMFPYVTAERLKTTCTSNNCPSSAAHSRSLHRVRGSKPRTKFG